MSEITIRAKLTGRQPISIRCPICRADVSHYDPLPVLEMPLDEVIDKIDEFIKNSSGITYPEPTIRVILDVSGTTIYGHPTKWEIADKTI